MDDLTRDVRELAVAMIERAADDPVARLGIMHAATQLITAMAIEAPDAAKMIDDLVGDIHAEATAMVELILAGAVIASESTPINANNVISMEKKLQ